MPLDASARGGRLAAALRVGLLLAAGAHLIAFLGVALARLAYPYELEWIEGGLADEVLAILRGQAPYAAPGVHGVAFIYPPMFFYAAAAVARVTGFSFLPLRLVSLAATLGCFALMARMARRAGGGRAAGWLAAGLFAATFKIGGNWLVLARVDALFVALFLAGAYALQRAAGGRGYALAGALLALSFLTKQSALLMTLPLAAYAVYADRRRGWLLGASFAIVALGASVLFNWASQGWYGYYAFGGALGQPPATGGWLVVWRRGLFSPLWPALLAGLTFLIVEWRARRAPDAAAQSALVFWLALAAGTAGTAFWVLLHLGAAENNLLPTLAVLAVLAALGLDRLVKRAMSLPAGRRLALLALVHGLFVLQFVQLAYNPLNYLPGNDNRAAGLALVTWVARVNGEVWLPQHGGAAWLAGKPASAHLAAMEDVLNAGGPPAGQLLEDARAALRQKRYAAIVVDGPDFAQLFPELEQNYAAAESLPLGAAFYSISGTRTLPEVVYVPRR